MRSKTFTGTDQLDINQQIWKWQTENRVEIKKQHPMQRLPHMPQNSVSVIVDYEELI